MKFRVKSREDAWKRSGTQEKSADCTVDTAVTALNANETTQTSLLHEALHPVSKRWVAMPSIGNSKVVDSALHPYIHTKTLFG